LFQTNVKFELMCMINFTVTAKYMITIISLPFLYMEEFATYILHQPKACRWMDETCSFYKWDDKDAGKFFWCSWLDLFVSEQCSV